MKSWLSCSEGKEKKQKYQREIEIFTNIWGPGTQNLIAIKLWETLFSVFIYLVCQLLLYQFSPSSSLAKKKKTKKKTSTTKKRKTGPLFF